MSELVKYHPEEGAFRLMEVGEHVDTKDAVAERVNYLKEKIQLARRLGLNAQARMFQEEIVDAEKPKMTVDPLSEDEIKIWRAFLPTEYQFVPTAGGGSGPMFHSQSVYTYDRIPHPVMAKWIECANAELFERYEIWTPEKKQEIIVAQDPVLVGVIGSKHYMIARWAESDANIIDLNKIKSILKHRAYFSVDNIGNTFVSLVIGGIALGTLTYALADSIPQGWLPWISTVLVAGGISGFLAASVSALITRQTDLLKTIRRHDKTK